MKWSLLMLSVLLGISSAFAQSFPDEMYLSPDGRRLILGGKSPDGLYDSSIIRRIDLTFSQSNYWQLMQQNYSSQTEIPATMTVDGVVYDSVGVRFKGETSYTMLPSGSKKTSFNISVDYIHEDQRIMGYKTLNLNNCFEDPSFMREVFYLHQERKHVPAARAAYVELYINGESWGLYPNIQQLNKNFYEEWFQSNDGVNWRADRPDNAAPGPGGGGGGWGDGTAALNYLGTDTAKYQTYYTLKSSDTEDPWTKLVNACNALNNTSSAQMTTVVPNYIDVDRALWFLASEIAFGDDDSYVHKGKMDYYVYYEPETGRITPIEYDGNSVLLSSTSSWTPFYNQTNANYPLMNKLLSVPVYRQRYLAHLRTLLKDEMDATSVSTILDQYKAQIDTYVQNDPKKLYTYSAFVSDVAALKTKVNSRRTTLSSNSEMAQVSPSISNFSWKPEGGALFAQPSGNESVITNASITHSSGLSSVWLYYSDLLMGNFNVTQMYDDGLHSDGSAGDGVYGGTIPGYSANTRIRLYIEARANNSAMTSSFLPEGAEHDVYTYVVKGSSFSAGWPVINELMADNSATVTDENGDYDDWFELYNGSDADMDISGYYLTDDASDLTQFQIASGTIIPKDGYLIFWADDEGAQGANHVNFKLSKGGELLMLLNSSQEVIDSVVFGAQTTDMGYARNPNGTGDFVIQSPTFNGNNSPTSISTLSNEQNTLLIYPNPANNTLNLKVEGPFSNTNFEVFNSSGEKILQGTTEGTMQFQTEAWPSGLYFIRIGTLVKKIMIAH
jgi:hypothetical protein